MWEDLPSNQKEKYKTLITKFASLSEAFAQKADDDSDTIIAPIVNSKFQETAFSYAFNATVEDIANSSYDALLTTKEGKKYIVGIKTFGVSSGDQKVAQFKASSNKWTADFEKIKEQALSAKDKSEADKINDSLYKRIARQIATLRNARIESSKAQLRGFNDESEVQSVYHFLMPSKKGALPSVTVGETSYREIDIDHIQIQGSTGQTTPQNFNFTDGYHNYRYTSADSQLLMDFHHSISSDNNDSIHIWPEWSVEYVDNAISVFENLSIKKDEDKIIESYSWMITDETGKVEPFSGFNGFYGASKLQKKDNYRENRIDKILQKFKHILTEEESTTIEQLLKIILLPDDSKDHVRIIQARDELMNLVKKIENPTLEDAISKMVYRPENEMYIPIPDSQNFHRKHPDFFTNGAGLFNVQGKKNKLLLPKERRCFVLRFQPSKNEIEAYINQDAGKAIQSYGSQDVLGKWILRKVFQLKPRQPLTSERLEELDINAIHLYKTADGVINLEFVKMDSNNPREDAIGWVKNNQKKMDAK